MGLLCRHLPGFLHRQPGCFHDPGAIYRHRVWALWQKGKTLNKVSLGGTMRWNSWSQTQRAFVELWDMEKIMSFCSNPAYTTSSARCHSALTNKPWMEERQKTHRKPLRWSQVKRLMWMSLSFSYHWGAQWHEWLINYSLLSIQMVSESQLVLSVFWSVHQYSLCAVSIAGLAHTVKTRSENVKWLKKTN